MMKKPYVIINCAISVDGKLALPTRKQIRISSEEDIVRVHKLRSECDAILVGIGTILTDNPKLTVKEKYIPNPRQPIRIVLDTYCRTPREALVVNKDAPTWIITGSRYENKYGGNVEVIPCSTKNGYIDLHMLLKLLADRGIRKLLVEGGGTTIWSFLKERLVDDLYIYIGSIIIGGKNTPTMVDGEGFREEEMLKLELINHNRLGEGLLLHYRIKNMG